MGRKPTVGGEAEHSQFAKDLTSYLTRIRDDSGLAGRGVSALTVGERSNSWWADIFNGKKILTTNDIHYIADLLGIGPYQFVEYARKNASGGILPVVTFNVPGASDDDAEQQPTSEQRLPLHKAAKRGKLKSDLAFEGNDEGFTEDDSPGGS